MRQDSQMGQPGPATSGPAVVAERRRVSILFVDLVGFTAFAEGRDPEEVRELQGRYFEACRTVIERYGGTVEKYIGDAVMAVWGAPVAQEDDAERAVRAALELVSAIHGLGVDWVLPDLAARAGIVSGEVAVSVGAIDQGMVAGDVVNTAARLQAASRPGAVLVDEATHLLARDAIAFEPAGQLDLRGKQVPVTAWEAQRIVALRRGEGRRSLPEPPLIGRDRELALAKQWLHAVGGEGTAHLLTIVGPAGIGKSRIVWELKKHADGVVERIAWHQARVPAFGEGFAYRVVAEMVRQRAGIVDGDGGRAAGIKLSACLSRFIPDPRERRWLRPHLAALVGLGPPTASERAEAFAAWRTFFERVADLTTSVLVFDHLQRADPGLLDFIEQLAAGAEARPLLIIASTRPDLLARRPEWGSGLGARATLDLRPLDRGRMAELLAAIAPGLPAAIAAKIVERAGGTPSFAVEIVRMLVDRGDVDVVEGIYRIKGPLDRLAVPATLHALIAARLDNLEPEDHDTIRDVAVLGQAFPAAAAAAVGRTTVAAVEPRLRRLVERDLLVADGSTATGARRHYRFGQWMVQEVAYATLALRDRRARHLAAARYYESLRDPEAIGAVATHLLAAYRASHRLAEAAELAPKAESALRAAAERASLLHASEQALQFLEGALTVVSDDAERAALWELAAANAQGAARLADAERYARQALTWYRANGERIAIARTAVRLGNILALGYDVDTSIAVVTAAIDDLGTRDGADDDPWLVELLAGLAQAYLLAGRTNQAAAFAERALEGAERIGRPVVVAGALATMGAAMVEDGRTREGIELMEASLAASEAHGLVVPGLRARNSLAVGFLADDPGAALDVASEGLELARRFGLSDLAVRLASNWSEAALDIGAWDRLLELVAELDRPTLPLTDRIDFESTAALVLAYREDPTSSARFAAIDALVTGSPPDLTLASLRCRQAAAALAMGRPTDALEAASIATAGFRATGLRTAVLWGVVPECRAAIWADDTDRAEASLAEIEDSGLRGRWVEAMLTTLRAGIDARRGRIDASAAGYARAANSWRRPAVPLQLGLSQLEAAQLLPAGRPEQASAIEIATVTFTELGATSLLERLRTGLDASPRARRV